ncbi:hypothetical protein CCHL11_07488 [Colletotrichum chlorophyti]|uniref:Uncharacterized protein n=1 Tax=Colletotrichum chlorophyti TaxID=708187 RepID=A0A1Q8RZH2_9PEZI|nr:hypothetical protein CCHL11_07488 [Colletotrichum chlorophyti]
MNWTEGALARHSRGKGWNSELGKQKQYIAKARISVYDSSRPSIASLSIHPRQSDLSVAGLGKLLPRYLEQTSPHFQRQQTLGVSPQDQHVETLFREPLRNDEPLTIKSIASQGPFSATETNKRKHVTDRDEALDSKRRRLLAKGDWAGINVQRTLPLHFPARGDTAGCQLWGSHNRNPMGQQSTYRRQTEHGKEAVRRRFAAAPSGTQGRSRNVKIRIGSEDIRVGESSQSEATNRHKAPLRTTNSESEYLQESTTIPNSLW